MDKNQFPVYSALRSLAPNQNLHRGLGSVQFLFQRNVLELRPPPEGAQNRLPMRIEEKWFKWRQSPRL